ncbi:unnamed protein product, partial [Closterium sp. NIES-65]
MTAGREHHPLMKGQGDIRQWAASGVGMIVMAKRTRQLAIGISTGCLITAVLSLVLMHQQHVWEGRKPSADLDIRLKAIEEYVARIAAENVTGVVREEVGRLGGQVESVQALQQARAKAGGNGTGDVGGDWAVVLEARARDAEQRAAQLNETVGRLTASMRKQAAEIVALKAAEQVAAGAGDLPKRPRGKMVVLDDDPSRWRQHSFHRTGAYGFIQYSAYRLEPARFVVVGLGALAQRSKRRLEGCWWHKMDGHTVIAGKLTQMVMEEHHNYLYEMVVLQCVLEEEVEETGGHLRIYLDRQILYPYREHVKEKLEKKGGEETPLPWRVAFCSSTLYAEVEERSVLQFIHYHRYAGGYDHFVLYDTVGLPPSLMAMLQPMLDEGLVTVSDFTQAYQFDAWFYSQAVAMHDCMYRMRTQADWVAFHDLDEYLALQPPATLPTILHRFESLPYITLGTYVFSAHICEEDGPEDVWSEEEKRFAVERMLQRRKKPYCLRGEDDPKVCIDYYGHRKMFVNPRKVEAVYVHRTDKPSTGGVDLSTDEMYFAHVRSINGKGIACRPPKDQENDLQADDRERCTLVAETAARARECAQDGFSNQ